MIVIYIFNCYRAHTKYDAKVMFSEFPSFCPQGGPGKWIIWLMSHKGGGQMHYLANVPGLQHFLAKKCSCPEGGWGGGGNAMQNAMQVAYISIMHCSLPVVSLLTCCQKEVLKACTCLYSQAARHSGNITPPPPPPRNGHFLACSISDIGTMACVVSNLDSNCLLVSYVFGAYTRVRSI